MLNTVSFSFWEFVSVIVVLFTLKKKAHVGILGLHPLFVSLNRLKVRVITQSFSSKSLVKPGSVPYLLS